MITHVLKSLAAAAYLLIIFMLPFQWYRISAAGEIFPAIDLIFIYYLSTYKHLKYWQLFLAGLIIDQLYQLPLGISSLSLMAANFGLYIISTWLLLRDYFTNLAIFCVYSLFIIAVRYLLVTINSTHHIEGMAIYFYFLTTIFAYPIIVPIISKPINILSPHAG